MAYGKHLIKALKQNIQKPNKDIVYKLVSYSFVNIIISIKACMFVIYSHPNTK